jgi:hypothetical protein
VEVKLAIAYELMLDLLQDLPSYAAPIMLATADVDLAA